MVLVIVALTAIGVGLSRGGRLRGLSELSIRGVVGIWVLLVGQLLVRDLLPSAGVVESRWLTVGLWGVLSLGLLILAVMNWRVPAMTLASAGIALNLVVVVLNGGMPVGGSLAASVGMTPLITSESSGGGFYHPAGPSTVLLPLADVIPVPAPRPLRSLLSAGDILLFVAFGLIIEAGIRKGRYRAKHSVRRAGAGTTSR
jgi:hypothetical protein